MTSKRLSPRIARAGLCSMVLAASALPMASGGCARRRTMAGPEADQRRPKPEAISLLGRPLHATDVVGAREKLEANLARARRELEGHPDDPGSIVWVGRRLGYLWRIQEAIEVYSRGIEQHPDYAPFYRHRGHRYISLRRFDEAVADLERATSLIAGKRDRVEPDGMPNERNIPLTTTAFNVWYHLGLAKYLQADYEGALAAYRETMKYSTRYDDNLAATTDWMYMTLRHLGRDREAAALLEPITPDMEIIENHAYHRRLLMYKGLLEPAELFDVDQADALDLATLGYGVGHWHLLNDNVEEAADLFRRIVSGPYWPAFGFIAAEVELARLEKR